MALRSSWPLLGSLAACAPLLREGCPTPLPPLVEVRQLDPTIRVDLRYRTPHNFTGAPLPGYDALLALLRPEAAAALARAQADLRRDGLGLLVWDAYRPVRATRAMVTWAQRHGRRTWVDSGYIAPRSRHNLGLAVDVTLVRLDDGSEVPMGTPFDEFSPRAHTFAARGDTLRARLRLRQALAAAGFDPYDREWWHFSLPGDAPPLDVPLRCFAARTAPPPSTPPAPASTPRPR